MPEQQNVNTIIKAADIFKSIAKGINRSSNIASNLGLSRSTTHRLLKTLQAAEFVVQDPIITLRYSLGPFAHYLADYSTRSHYNLIFCALPRQLHCYDSEGIKQFFYAFVGTEQSFS